MSTETSEGERHALQELIHAAEALGADFGLDAGAALSPVVARELPRGGILLASVIESFGWDGRGFDHRLDVQQLICRLKSLIYADGLEQKGRGAYATVYRGRNRLSGEVVTLKKLYLDYIEDGIPANTIREVSLLRELGHPNVVELKDVLWDDKRLFMVLEYLDHDLRQHLDTHPEASHPDNVRLYMFQILQGLEYVHARGVMHRDLKPQNILVDKANNNCKLADFGLARSFVLPYRAYTHEVVTLLYRAPELLLGSKLYSTSVDMWSAGCIFVELATRRPLFEADSEIGQLYAIFERLGTPSEATWPGVTQLPHWQPMFPKWHAQDLQLLCGELEPLGLDLLRQMLRYDPNQRITARRALEHPYFRGMRPYYHPSTPAQRSSQAAPGMTLGAGDTDHPMGES